MAEEVGFEPTVRSHARRFSRPVQSTTLPLLRARLAYATRPDSKSRAPWPPPSVEFRLPRALVAFIDTAQTL